MADRRITHRIKDIDTALRIYYMYPELTNADIKILFGGNISNFAVNTYKKYARQQEIEDGVKTIGFYTVNTECAYKAWGIDVESLEKRRAKLKKLGLEAV